MNKHCVVVYWCIIDILMEVMKLTHHLKYADGSVGNRSFVGTIVTVFPSPTCLPSNHLMLIYNRHSIIYYFKIFLYLFLAMLHSLWDLNSPTRDQTSVLAVKVPSPTSGPPWNFRLEFFFLNK